MLDAPHRRLWRSVGVAMVVVCVSVTLLARDRSPLDLRGTHFMTCVAQGFSPAHAALKGCATGYESASIGRQIPILPPANSAQTTGTVAAILEEAFRLYDRDQYDEARRLFDRALGQAREDKNVVAEAEAHRGLGLVLNERAEYSAARVELQLSLSLYEALSDRAGIARVTSHLAGVAQMMGEGAAARELYNRALSEYEALGDRRREALVLLNLTFSVGLNRAEEQGLLERGLAIAAELGDGRLQASFLHKWGDELFTNDDYAAAQDKLEQAAALFEKVGARSDLARALTSLGRVQRAHGYPDRALEFYRRALTILEEIGDQQGVIQSINAIAVTHGFLQQYREAIEQYQRALALARQTGSPRLITFQLGNLAGGYLRTGDNARAAEILETVVAQEKDTNLLSTRYDQLSQAFFNQGRYQLALETLEKSQKLTGPEPTARMGTFYQKARIEQKMGLTSEAVADAREALRILEDLRGRLVPTDFMKRGFGDWYKDIHGFSIALLHQSGHETEAFEAAEQARGRAFLDLLAGRDLRLKGSAQGALAEAQQLEGTLRASGVDPASVASGTTYELTSRGGDSELAALWRRWQKTDPQIRSLVTTAPFSSREAAATAARLHSTILSYWVGPDVTLIWAIGADGSVRSARVEVPATRITELVQATWAEPRAGLAAEAGAARPPARLEKGPRRALLTRGGDSVLLDDAQQRAWRELYRLLIQPIRAALPAPGQLLTIEPQGPLFRLSFAALLDESDKYLIEKYPLHYTPAAGVLQFTKREPRPDQDVRYLFVADPTGMPVPPDRKPLPPLPGARREVQAIARLLPAGAVTVLAGADATEDRFRSLLPNKTIIHLATHGIVRDDQPLDSFLALGASASADGRLSAQKIYGLDLRADLVVLSACRSGLGKISGDGIVGLARAFFYAGTSSVVATLWDVADEPAGRLVPQFYRALLRVHDKSRALRAAQLQLLRDLRAGRVRVATPDGEVVLPEHPLFWAAYVLVGEP